jgi:hypothetical protein
LGTLVFLIEIYSLEISMLSYFYFSLSRIEYSNQVGDIQVEWALGAFVALMQSTNSEPSQTAATSTIGCCAGDVPFIWSVYGFKMEEAQDENNI